MAKTKKIIYERKDEYWKNRFIFFQFNKKKYDFWLDKWLMNKKLFVKYSTYIRYKNHIENHIMPELGGYFVKKISTDVVEDFVSKKLLQGRLDEKGGLSQKTVSDILSIVKSSLKYARSYGMSTICSFDNISFKNKTREIRVLSRTEEQRLLKVLLKDLDRIKLGILICLCTGIRVGELCALNSNRISVTDKTLKIDQTLQRLQVTDNEAIQKTQIIITEPKSLSARRVIPLPVVLMKLIKPFLTSSNSFILTGDCERFIEPRTMQNRFKAYLKEARIEDANFHCLRHTFATRCIEANFDIKSLSEILGHSSVKITLDRYVHSSLQLKRNNMKKISKNSIEKVFKSESKEWSELAG